MSKECTKCGVKKSFNAFVKDKSKSDGYSSNCKACRKVSRDQRKEVRTEYDRKYNAKNQSWIKKRRQEYRDKNRDKIAAYGKQRYEQQKASVLQQKKIYRKHIVDNLTDAYVRQQIIKSGWVLPVEDIPQELIIMKRLSMIGNRNLKLLQNDQ